MKIDFDRNILVHGVLYKRFNNVVYTCPFDTVDANDCTRWQFVPVKNRNILYESDHSMALILVCKKAKIATGIVAMVLITNHILTVQFYRCICFYRVCQRISISEILDSSWSSDILRVLSALSGDRSDVAWISIGLVFLHSVVGK